jgi:hypothetical protein
MAIQNASDLLVYAKTSAAAAQVTRVYIKSSTPIEDFTSGTSIIFNNLTDENGVITDGQAEAITTNTGTDVLSNIAARLAIFDYTASTVGTQGIWKYRDFTNGEVGLVPTLEVTNGTATFEENAVIIEIVTPGSSAIFDPVAYSTSASFSTNMDLRDITNKDSGGWSESLVGLKSFEVSTDILQSINPDVPLDGTDFFDKLKARSIVDLSFSDRIRNIIRTNLTQSGVDGFLLSTLTQYNLQTDPFSGSTASKLTTGASTNNRYLGYTIDATRVENKKINWSFYVKGSGSTTQASFALSDSTIANASTVTNIEGGGTITSPASGYYKITGLSTSTWTRISFQTETISLSGSSTLSFYIYPGLYSAQDSDVILTSSWQIELAPEATDYQDPTDITHWQGNALVSSVSFDAGVEDNLTCSASFTGTGQIYPNGLGPELIEDTGFDDPSYWTVNASAAGASSVVENGYGKFITTGDYTSISKALSLTAGDYYSLTFTASTSTTGAIKCVDGWGSTDPVLLKATATGTYTVLLKPDQANLVIAADTATTIWLSSISLKKVL